MNDSVGLPSEDNIHDWMYAWGDSQRDKDIADTTFLLNLFRIINEHTTKIRKMKVTAEDVEWKHTPKPPSAPKFTCSKCGQMYWEKLPNSDTCAECDEKLSNAKHYYTCNQCKSVHLTRTNAAMCCHGKSKTEATSEQVRHEQGCDRTHAVGAQCNSNLEQTIFCRDCGHDHRYGNTCTHHGCDCRVRIEKEDIAGAKRYGGWAVDEFIAEMCLNFRLGNVVKYISRAGKKNGTTALADLKKAREYLNRQIERMEEGKQ